jgi:hypothetical protein
MLGRHGAPHTRYHDTAKSAAIAAAPQKNIRTGSVAVKACPASGLAFAGQQKISPLAKHTQPQQCGQQSLLPPAPGFEECAHRRPVQRQNAAQQRQQLAQIEDHLVSLGLTSTSSLPQPAIHPLGLSSVG